MILAGYQYLHFGIMRQNAAETTNCNGSCGAPTSESRAQSVANEPASNQAGCASQRASQRASRRASQRYNPRRSLRRNAVRGIDGSFSEPSVAIRGRVLDNRLDRAANVIGAE
jgi:hypothetical protein